ncbi:MAG: FecR domain-containing protein, partial [Opitutae bacterium]|nr:FecR domain-containing protein [Opitutae bacterium]
MNIRKLLISLFVALSTMTVAAFAQTQAAETTVAKIKGSVMAQLPDGSTVTVQPGMKLPQGATISTGANSEAYLVSHSDTVSVVTADSVVGIDEVSVTTANGQVTEQKTLLDLKSGNLVSKLNPAKKSVNNYAVRTPKGVAAARGTVFTVSYKGTNYTIAVLNGTVQITPDAGVAGGISFNVGAGQVTGT